MRALLLLLLTLLARPAAAQDAVSLSSCKDDQADCKDECTVEFGGSSRTYEKLGACLQKCKQKYDKCQERQFALEKQEKAEPEPGSSSEAPATGTDKPEGQGDANVDVSSGATPSAPAPEPKATGTPEPGKAPESKPSKPAAKAPESKPPEPLEDMSELDQLFDDLQTAPPPKPKGKAKAEPTGSKPASAPKKTDAAGEEPTEK